MRFFWNAVGCSALTAGVFGAVLPLLPATPFFILAAYAFSRGTPKIEAWLLGHARWGPLIQNWRRERAISRKAKVTSIAVICLTPALTWALGASILALAAQAAVLSAVVLFIATRPAPATEKG